MAEPQRFQFSSSSGSVGEASLLPRQGLSVNGSGLLDTGATVNVLPWRLGVELGAIWQDCRRTVSLAGNLSHVEARILVLNGVVGNFSPVALAFAWTRSEAVPLVLGQVNFFMEFDVWLFRSRMAFEVKPK